MISIETTLKGDYAHVRLSGILTPASVRQLVETVGAFCAEHGVYRVLVDARPLDQPPSDTLRHQTGAYVAEQVGSRLKIAVLYLEGHVNKMLEMSAANRGANLIVTDSEEEAITWLLKPGAPAVQ